MTDEAMRATTPTAPDQDTGVPCGLGSRASHEAASASSPKASIPPNACKYAFFTPYNRGFDLVFDYLCAQEEWQFSSGLWSIQASYGYERCRVTEVRAEDQYVGTAHSLIERFTPIAAAYQRFMFSVETAATQWVADKSSAKEAEVRRTQEQDAGLCERVLAASAIEAMRPERAQPKARARLRRRTPMTDHPTAPIEPRWQDDPAFISSLRAVQDDDAEWLRLPIEHRLVDRARLERIASRLSPTPETGLVEALREDLRVLMLEQSLSGLRNTYSDGFASGLAEAIRSIDALYNVLPDEV